MKKTAIALAVAAVGLSAAQAQNVAIEGYFDRGWIATNSSNNASDSVRVGAGSGTDTIGIVGSEDLGGGLRASFRINTDFGDQAGVNLDAATTTATYIAGAVRTGGFANSQVFLALEGKDFGTIRLGSPNDLILTAVIGVGQPGFSTAIGSIYSSAFSVHEGMGTGTPATAGLVSLPNKTNASVGYAGARMVRQRDTIQYLSPNFSGFQFGASYTATQDKSGAGSAAANDAVGRTEFMGRFTSGALDVMAATSKYDVGSNVVDNASDTRTLMIANTSYTNTAIAASFGLTPAVRLHAGAYSSKASRGLGTVANTAAVDSQASSFGASYALSPATTLMGVMASTNDKTTMNMDRRLTGLGLNYALSKRTRAYLRYDQIETDAENRGTAGNKLSRTALGLAHTF